MNQQTGRARRWKRSLRIADHLASWARDDSVSNNVKRASRSSRGGARAVSPRQAGVGAGAGAVGVGNDQWGPSQNGDRSQGRGPNQVDDDLLSDDSADELDDGISDSDSEDDGIDPDVDSPPATPISDVSPTLTLSAPDVGVTTTSLPSTTAVPAIPSSTTASTMVVTTMSPVVETGITMTPIVVSRSKYTILMSPPDSQQETAVETPSIASSLLASTVPLPEITSRPQKGIIKDEIPTILTPLPAIDDSISSTTISSIISTTPTLLPITSATPEIPQEYDREKFDDDDDFRDAFRDGPPPGPSGLSPASEHALIAVGSIGRSQTVLRNTKLRTIANMI